MEKLEKNHRKKRNLQFCAKFLKKLRKLVAAEFLRKKCLRIFGNKFDKTPYNINYFE